MEANASTAKLFGWGGGGGFLVIGVGVCCEIYICLGTG